MRNVILSAYFTSRPDPQSDVQRTSHNPGLMRVWYESALANISESTGLVVFHDGSVDEQMSLFFNKAFFPCAWPTEDMSLNDFRYVEYLLYLRESGSIEKVFLTDLFDVEFYRDPFELIQSGKLCIGSNDTWKDKPRQHARLEKLAPVKQYLDKPLLNPGIVGGEVSVVVEFIRDMLPRLGAQFNNNMPLANVVGYSDKWKDRLITGYPLHTIFKKYQGAESGACIRHK